MTATVSKLPKTTNPTDKRTRLIAGVEFQNRHINMLPEGTSAMRSSWQQNVIDRYLKSNGRITLEMLYTTPGEHNWSQFREALALLLAFQVFRAGSFDD